MDWLKIVNKADRVVEVNIEGVIGGGWFLEGITMEEVNNDLKDLKAIDADIIKVNITNSPGGSVLHGLGIYDILTAYPAKKEVKVLGMAASMAAVLTMVAKKEDREMTPNSWFLIHKLKGMLGGTINEIENGIDFYKKNEKKLVDILTGGTGIEADKIKDWMAENNEMGNFWTAEETKENGFIGKVEGKEPVSMAAFAENIDNLPNLPKNLTKMKQTDDNVIDKLINGLKSLFDKDKDNSDKVLNDLKTKTMNEIEKLTDAFKIESDKLKADITANDKVMEDLKADLVKVKADLAKAEGEEIVVDPKNDPTPTPAPKSEFGEQLLDAFSSSQKRQLKNNTNK